MALAEKRWEQAAQLSDQALQIDPQQTAAHYLNAVANSSLGRLDVAEKSALQVLESNQDQTYPFVHYVLGWIMSQRGNFHSAAVEYRRFLEIQPHVPRAEKLKAQLTQWEKEGLIQKPEVNN
jgi:Tfp pilus assembly protein PilF